MNHYRFLVMDFEGGFETARRLHEDGNEVYYYSQREKAYPEWITTAFGDGFGFPRVKHWTDVIDKVDYICFDEETEILTENGWKPFKQLGRDEKVATLNSDGYLEYQRPERHIRYKFKGELLAYESERVNFAVTPKHRMYVRRQYDKKFGLISVDDLFGRTNIEFKKDAKWKGVRQDTFVLPEHQSEWTTGRPKIRRVVVYPERRLDMKMFMSFLGFYLAEGHVSGRTKGKYNTVEIGQNAGETADAFEKLLKSLGFNYSVDDRNARFKRFRIHDFQLAAFLSYFGNGAERHILPEFKRLDADYLRCLWEWYLRGDGGRSKLTRNWNYFSTISKQLKDDLIEIALKLGISCKEILRSERIIEDPKGKTYRCKPAYVVSLNHRYNSPIIRQKKWKKIPYDGYVYCVSVPNRVIYVRRKNVPIWCGNCFPEIGHGPLVDWLRERGYKVFGANKRGELLENDRMHAKRIMKELGIQFPKTYQATGVSEVISYLQEHQGSHFLKMNQFRGDLETVKVSSADQAEAFLSNLHAGLGPHAKMAPVVIEEKIDGCYIGQDMFFNGEKFLSPFIFGFEDFGADALEKATDRSPFDDTFRRLAKYLSEIGYRGPFSLEAILTEDGGVYVLDPTARFPFTLSMIYMNHLRNLGDVIVACAEGKEATPEYDSIYAVNLNMKIEEKTQKPRWFTVEYPEDVKVRFLNAMKFNDKVYVHTGGDHAPVITVTAMAPSVSEACDQALLNMGKVETIHGVYNDTVESTFKVEYIEAYEKISGERF